MEQDNFVLAYDTYRGKIATFTNYLSIHVGRNLRAWEDLSGWTKDDWNQEFCLVLWRCVRQYDPMKGAKFNSYLFSCLRNRAISITRGMCAKSRMAKWVDVNDPIILSQIDLVMMELPADVESEMRNILLEQIHKIKEVLTTA